MRLTRIIAFVSLITMLSGCQNGLFGMGNPNAGTKYEQCTRLKRQIVFFRNDMNHNYQWNSPARKAQLLADYERYNCDDVLAHKDDVTSRKSPLSSDWKQPNS